VQIALRCRLSQIRGLQSGWISRVKAWWTGKDPESRRIWTKTVCAVILVIFLVGLWNPRYGLGLFFSLLHADIAIAYWLGVVGVGKWTAIFIAIILGGASLYNICWFFNLRQNGAVTGQNTARGWLARKAPYAALPFFPVDPYFGATAGVAFSKALNLKKWPTFALLQLGNSAKMVIIGLGINKLHEATSSWAPATAILVLVAIIIHLRCRKTK